MASDEEYIPGSSPESSNGNTTEEENDNSSAGGSTSNTDMPTLRGRKRSKNENAWKKNIRKKMRNSGKSYQSPSTGKTVSAKTFPINFDCKCRRNCCDKIGNVVAKKIFDSFWKLGDFSQQNVYLRGLVQAKKTERSRIRNGSAKEKSTTFEYSLQKDNTNIIVCKKYFLNTFQISWGRLYRCLSKEEVFAVTDSRGRHTPGNKVYITHVVEHIKSFPSYQSHYSRKENPNRRFLHPDLSIRKMYLLYKEKCDSENKVPVKEKFYYKIFTTKFNLHFKQPSKDMCRLCDELQMKINVEKNENYKNTLFTQKQLHLRKADLARETMHLDKAKVLEQHYVCTFDLEKALPFPKISTSIAYYKRNLYVYNLGVHSFNNAVGYMYTWDETVGGRGSQNVATVIKKHLAINASDHKHIILFSDACTGQNRNIKMALTLLKLVQIDQISADIIDHKVMTSGHSYLPNDGEFGVIENASRQKEHIYTPNDWVNIIRTAKKKTLNVCEMKHHEFLSTKSLEDSVINRKKDVDGVAFNWLKIQWLRFVRGSSFSLYIKETLKKKCHSDK